MNEPDCSICQGYGYTDEENTTLCPACNGDGIVTYPEGTRFGVVVRVIDVRVIWLDDAESPTDAYNRAKQDGDLYEYFENARRVDGYWEVDDRAYDIYQDGEQSGPIEHCQHCGAFPPVSMGKYGHKSECPKHPPPFLPEKKKKNSFADVVQGASQ
jgi:hypothetical protein